MDLNDIIGVPSDDGAMESTLESEIDALSKIITDTKDVPQRLDDNDVDFGDDLAFTANSPLGMKDILNSSGEMDSFMSAMAGDSDLPDASKGKQNLVARSS